MPIREEDRLPDVEYKFIFMMDIVSQDIISNGLLREAIKYIDDSVRHGLNIIVHWLVTRELEENFWPLDGQEIFLLLSFVDNLFWKC